jgi:hypothetical protein
MGSVNASFGIPSGRHVVPSSTRRLVALSIQGSSAALVLSAFTPPLVAKA